MMTHPCHPPVVPPQYPYGTSAHDSYTFCVCGKIPQGVPPFPEYPTNGPFKGNGFATKDTFPYLIDTTYTSYGQLICFSESVYTKITQRQDPSCINLAATFNMTDTTLTNTVRTDFLQKYISRKYGVLNGVLPIIKTSIKFKIYYSITDIDGGLLHKGIAVSTVLDNHFHFTDIRDLFVQSARGVIIENIPAVTYAGLYNITIDRVEAYVNVINTYDHLQDGLNPYYSFRDNNMKIVLNHSIIEQETPDEEILIAECDVNKTFEYRANVTNRLRMSFVAFTNIPIAVGSTVGIYEALNEPTEEIITQLRNEVSACEDEIKHLHEIIEQQGILIQTISNQVELNRNNIASLLNRVSLLEQNGESYDARLDNHELRISKLEAVPLATVLYKRDVQFVKGQITWETHGELYQVTKDFVGSGNFNNEIIAGNIVPCVVGDVDVSGIMERIDVIEETANDASSTATEAATLATTTAETVGTFDERITDATNTANTASETATSASETATATATTVETLSTTVTGITDDIHDIEIDIQAINETLGTIKRDVIPYGSDTLFTAGQLTYDEPGVLYQVVENYGASGDIEDDYANGKLIPVCDEKAPVLYDKTKVAVIKLDASDNDTDDVTYYTTLADAKTYMDANSSNMYKLIMGSECGITEMSYDLHGTENLKKLIINSTTNNLSSNSCCSGCTALEYVKFAPTITNIPSSMFAASGSFHVCGNLATVELPAALETINNFAFDGCTNLTNIQLPSGVTSVGTNAFKNVPATLVIPSGIVTIRNSAFSGSGVTTVNISSAIEAIDVSAFENCTSLESVTIESSATSLQIKNYAFSGCTSLESVTLPANTVAILDYAFSGDSALTSISIPTAVTSIGASAFADCTSLATVTLAENSGLLNLVTGAFKNSGITSFVYPENGNMPISESVFENCTSLESVTLPNNTPVILNYAFKGCTSLTSIDIPASVQAIYGNSFDTSILTINIDKSENSIANAPWGATNATINWLG